MSDASEGFHSILATVKKAKNDSEKFAALLIITKLVKAEILSLNDRRSLYQAIGFSFPLRLILSPASEDVESRELFINIGASVLSAYSADETLIQSPEMIQAVPKILSTFQHLTKDSKLDTCVIIDFLQIMCSLAATADGSYALLRHSAVDTLCKFYCTNNDSSLLELVWIALLHLAKNKSDSVWNVNKDNMINFLQTFASNFCAVNSELKFKLATQITELLNTMSLETAAIYADQPWLEDMVKALSDILISRVSSKERNPTLKLCYCLSQLFGLDWTKHSDAEISKRRFPVILIRLSCIEVGMIAYEDETDDKLTHKQNLEQADLLLACFGILEIACTSIADFDQESSSDSLVLSFDDIRSLDNPLKDAVKAVQGIVSKLLRNCCADDFLLACVRLLGSWLNVEPFATSETGLEIAPTVLSAFKVTLHSNPSIAIKTCIPALMNYITNGSIREQMLDSTIMNTLCELALNATFQLEDKTLVLQCLIGFVLEHNECKSLIDKLDLLTEAAVSTHSKNNVVVNFYLSVLILVLWNRSARTCESHSLRFFRWTCSLVHGVHSLNGNRVELAKRYQSKDDDINQLFPIMIKELTAAIQAEKSILKIVRESGLPQKIDSLLQLDHREDDLDVLSSYQILSRVVGDESCAR